jgi:GntR family transcriptional regulator
MVHYATSEPVNAGAPIFDINPATAAKAFAQLVDGGILYKRRGLGMFVSSSARDQLRSQHRSRFFLDGVDPRVAEARQIDVPLREIVERLEALERGEDQ